MNIYAADVKPGHVVNGATVQQVTTDRGAFFAHAKKDGKRIRIYLGAAWDIVPVEA